MCLTRHGSGKKCLAGTRRANQQRALRKAGADIRVLLRVMEEIHDFLQGILRLFLARHIGKGLAGLRLRVNLGIGFSKGHGIAAAHTLLHLLRHHIPKEYEYQNRKNPG